MALTDEEYLLLEQLTYLDSSVYIAADIDQNESSRETGKHVKDILYKFTDLNLKELATHTKPIGTTHTSGKEWAQLIRAIKNDKNLTSLQRTNDKLTTDVKLDDGSTQKADIAYVYVKPGDDNQAIVTFKGTTGSNEWADDVYAMGVSDSPCQEQALEFVNGLKYHDVIAIGHSKGGNKAQYVGVTSDKVSRAISFDGEGFSKQFLDKYKDSIQVNAKKITCYAVSSDFVHELGKEINGANYKYVKGVGIDKPEESHCSNSFFTVADNGKVYFRPAITEKIYISLIRNLTGYIIFESQKNGDWAEMEPTLEQLAGLIGGNSTDMGEATDKIVNKINEDPDVFATIFAYAEQRLDPLNKFGIYNIMNRFLSVFGADVLGTSFNINWKQLLKRVESKKRVLNAIENKSIKDFSVEKCNAVEQNQKDLSALRFPNIEIWNSYSEESWFEELPVKRLYNHVKNVERALEFGNIKSVHQVKTVFEAVQQADTDYGNKIKNVNDEIRSISSRILNLSNQIAYKK